MNSPDEIAGTNSELDSLHLATTYELLKDGLGT